MEKIQRSIILIIIKLKVEVIDANYVKVKVDDISQLDSLKSTVSRYQKGWKQKYGTYVTEEIDLYEILDGQWIRLHRGFIFLLISKFHSQMENLQDVQNTFKNQFQIDVSGMKNLRSDQSMDLTHLLGLNIGLFQVMTGYGKTEVISTLLKYLNDNNIKTLVVTSSSKAFDELLQRCKKFDLHLDKHYKTDRSVNLVNAKGFFSSSKSTIPEVLDDIQNTEFLLFDEVEKCLNPSTTRYLESYLSNRKCTYGFSATTNKVSTERLYPGNESYLHERNLDLIRYFGIATVYRLPEIGMKDVNLHRFQFPLWLELNPEKDTYDHTYLRNFLYMDNRFVYNMKDVIDRLEKGVYIPINSKISINHWTSILSGYRVLVISADGYILDGIPINLEMTKDKMRHGEIDIIFSTMSGYNSLDIPNIKSILLLMSETSPDNILQAIGRSREKEMTVATIEYDRTVPIYSKKRMSQLDQVRSYYQNVTLKEEVIYVR